MCATCWEPRLAVPAAPCPYCGGDTWVSEKLVTAVELIRRWDARDLRILRLAEELRDPGDTQST